MSDAPAAVVAAKVRIPAADSFALARLDALMNRLWTQRLGLVVAPAGSGKTTLLARFASEAGAPAAWYRCESWDSSEAHLLRHLEEAFAGVLGPSTRKWESIEGAIVAIERVTRGRLLLVIDDAHAIAGTPAEAALERFIEYAPPGLLTILASRAQPGFNLSRLRVSGALAEIGGDDLRFRSWEVESLFRDFYHEPLPPVELAELAQRTEGWAAGLQLFHLATSGKALDERRRVLRALGGGSRLVRDYLARNVLDELPAALRDFLIETCVLGRLSGAICDQFLGRADSALLLQELELRQIFTTALGGDGDYRYHEVLRSHLEHVLISQVGERGLRGRCGKAGAVLEQFGAIPEALHAYCRAEDWTAVDRLLGRNGAQLASRTGVWIDSLPPAVLDHDPWLLLASARRNRAEGRWKNAIEVYQRAEQGFIGLEGAQLCQRERVALASWLTPTPSPPMDAIGLLRLASMRDPLAVKAQLGRRSGGHDLLVGGVASLLAGELQEAGRLFARAAESAEEGEDIAVGARMGSGLAALLAGNRDAIGDLELAVEDADSRGLGFLARLGRACAALAATPVAVTDAKAVRIACGHIGDLWGEALAAMFQGWGLLMSGSSAAAVAALDGVAERFHELGGAVLEAWSKALIALALAGQRHPTAKSVALKAESIANSAAVEGPKAFAFLALSRVDAPRATQFAQLARSALARTGFDTRMLDIGGAAPKVIHTLSITCFGAFRFVLDGRAVAMKSMKPRTHALLRRLCADAGSAVHREMLEEALWPDTDAEAAAHNLHVAVSSLRKALEPDVSRGASSLLVREGDTYRLVLPPGSEVDVRAFDDALDHSRRARQSGDVEGALEAFEQAAVFGTQDFLPEDGSAEWVTQRRGRSRAALTDAARPLAKLLLSRAQNQAAAQVCAKALEGDRYDDELWRLLIQAREKGGDEAGSRRAHTEYRRVVAELDVPATRP